MTARSDIAAGLLGLADAWPDRATAIARAEDHLRQLLHPSAVWLSADLPPELRGAAAYGEWLPTWSSPGTVTADEAQILDAAWAAALPPLDRGMRRYVRVQVDTVDDVRTLRAIGSVDGLVIVPSLRSRGHLRPLRWRWPFRVGVLPGPLSDGWLSDVQHSEHHGTVFDAEPYDIGSRYEIAIISSTDLSELSEAVAMPLGDATCVIVAGDDPVDQMLSELERRVEPIIAIAVEGSPDRWWRTFFHEMSHDVPIDAATQSIIGMAGADALIAGPTHGMDVTASAHWFAAVAPDFPGLAPLLDEFAGWDWRYESGGATRESQVVRDSMANGNLPIAFVPPPAMAAPAPFEPGEGFGDGPAEMDAVGPPVPMPPAAVAPGGRPAAPTAAPPPTAAKPPRRKPTALTPRRLVARVFEAGKKVKKVLPPERDLEFAVRIAIPQRGDTAADVAAPAIPGAPGPTAELEVIVSGDVWTQQPPPQTISVSRTNDAAPSTWAVFPFRTPASGNVVRIEVTILYQGKPLQAATYVSPVRSTALPLERPTFTTFALSGPDQPTPELRPVDVSLNGTGAELKYFSGSDAQVLITDVQAMLDQIEDRVSRVLGVPDAPDALDDPRVLELLITLAGIGHELSNSLAPLAIGDARSINVTVNPLTKVLPLELVYSGPVPDDHAKLCDHVHSPPPPGEACRRASSRRVCPYAFWGMHRTISRTIKSTTVNKHPWTSTISTSSVLYAATVIADDHAPQPLPSVRVRDAAEQMFPGVTQANNWRDWRKAVTTDKPDVMVVLGHTMIEGAKTNLYIGRESALDRRKISSRELSRDGSHRPLVLLIACATAALGDPFGTLPGAWTANGAGAVVGTLSKIVGPQGATATTHLLQAIHDVAGQQASVGDAVADARRSLITAGHPIGLMLVSHGEIDTHVEA